MKSQMELIKNVQTVGEQNLKTVKLNNSVLLVLRNTMFEFWDIENLLITAPVGQVNICGPFVS